MMATGPGPASDPPQIDFKDGKPYKVFISFNFNAQDRAENLKKLIDEAFGPGTCWICTDAICGGQNIRHEIALAIKKAPVFISAISLGYTDSKECQSEVNLARELNKIIIPILLDKLEWPLKESGGEMSGLATIYAGILYKPASSTDREELEQEIQHVIDTVREALGSPAAEPISLDSHISLDAFLTVPESQKIDREGEPPADHLVLSVFVLLCCCLVCGIVALFHSKRIRTKWAAGDRNGALEESKKAKQWSIIGLIVSGIVWAVSLIVIITVLASSDEANPDY